MVQHMTDNPDNAHIMDSTQYDNDGTKKGANEPIETSGKIDSAQSFDGINDYVKLLNCYFRTFAITVLASFKTYSEITQRLSVRKTGLSVRIQHHAGRRMAQSVLYGRDKPSELKLRCTSHSNTCCTKSQPYVKKMETVIYT